LTKSQFKLTQKPTLNSQFNKQNHNNLTMTTPAKTSGKSAFDLKGLMKSQAGNGASILGFASGHLAFGAVPETFKSGIKGVLASVLLIVVGAFISFKGQSVDLKNDVSAKRNAVQGFGTGLVTYGGVKALNIAFGSAAPTATAGLDAIPEGLRKIVSKFVPTLGDAEPIPMDYVNGMEIYDANADLGQAVETEYEFVEPTAGLDGEDDQEALDIPTSGTDETAAAAAFSGLFATDDEQASFHGVHFS
jgi:hypothetical protein